VRSRFLWAALAALVAGCGSHGGGSSRASGAAAGANGPQPALAVSGGIVAANVVQPLLFAWNSPLTVTGSGFVPGESVDVVLFGPTNSIGVSPATLRLGGFSADLGGGFSGSLAIPYDGGVTGTATHIPRPGAYRVQASSQLAGTVAAPDLISLAPETTAALIDWGHERGGRFGNLPGPWLELSPERADPEWVSVWDERPVGAYGTVDDAHISASDNPGKHYTHDANFFLLPDPDYRWIIGTHNFADEGAGAEVEWEILNGGSPDSNGAGAIGLPLWAMPSDGDRVYLVGRWILDVGHPDTGSSTEIHPPRLLATMRRRPTLDAAGRPAAQVDVYVSGHGGGADRVAYGLSAALDFPDGRGGGRIQDLGGAAAATYYQPGPASSADKVALAGIGYALGLSPADLATFLANVAALPAAAGPSAFGWLPDPNEQQPIDGMDYEFDVPLPPEPAGATAAQVEVDRQPQDAGTVTEVITYPDFPRSAHVRLPYAGAGGGVYARTLKFAWTPAGPAPKHFHVQIARIDVVDLPGLWRIFGDVCGQWTDLGHANGAFAQAAAGQIVPVGADFDVYLGPQDGLHVAIMGYRAEPLDSLFGQLFGFSAYDQLLAIAALAGTTGTRDNDRLGEAVLELQPPLPTAAATTTVAAMDGSNPGHFQMEIFVEPK
jgi:hypothetical protein